MGKPTISMAIFNGYVANYQRVAFFFVSTSARSAAWGAMVCAREVLNDWEVDSKDKPVKEIKLIRTEAGMLCSLARDLSDERPGNLTSWTRSLRIPSKMSWRKWPNQRRRRLGLCDFSMRIFLLRSLEAYGNFAMELEESDLDPFGFHTFNTLASKDGQLEISTQ